MGDGVVLFMYKKIFEKKKNIDFLLHNCNREERWDIFLFVQTDFTDLLFTGFEPISFQFEIKQVKVKKLRGFEPVSFWSVFQAATTEL